LHCGSTSNSHQRQEGDRHGICGDPKSIANISFEQRLSEAKRRQLGPGQYQEDFPITRNEL
jgi:hypothetical protein